MAEHQRLSLLAFLAVGLATAALLVIFVAPRASSSPDGLNKVAADQGFDAGARPHALEDSPFAGYGTGGVDHEAIGTIIAGLVGVAATFVVCAGLVYLIRRRRDSPGSPASPATPAG